MYVTILRILALRNFNQVAYVTRRACHAFLMYYVVSAKKNSNGVKTDSSQDTK
jgi:hypothetical protein